MHKTHYALKYLDAKKEKNTFINMDFACIQIELRDYKLKIEKCMQSSMGQRIGQSY